MLPKSKPNIKAGAAGVKKTHIMKSEKCRTSVNAKSNELVNYPDVFRSTKEKGLESQYTSDTVAHRSELRVTAVEEKELCLLSGILKHTDRAKRVRMLFKEQDHKTPDRTRGKRKLDKQAQALTKQSSRKNKQTLGPLEKKDVKVQLSELAAIPPQEFERKFRNWMESDDVVRAMQAKLRMDLIQNFNKTKLGKQLHACMASSKAGGSVVSGCFSQTATHSTNSKQLITVEPLVLALHTLVAEFLHVQNCHFSLSVFCSEMPYINSLPDFDNRSKFRFEDAEIRSLVQSVSSGNPLTEYAAMLLSSVKKEYNQTQQSLLFALVKILIDQQQKLLRINRRQKQKSAISSLTQWSHSMRKHKICRRIRAKSSTSQLVSNKCQKKHSRSQSTQTKAAQLAKSDSKPQMRNKLTNTQTNQKPHPKISSGELEISNRPAYLIALGNRMQELVVLCKKVSQRHNKRLHIAHDLSVLSQQLQQDTVRFEKSGLTWFSQIYAHMRRCVKSVKRMVLLHPKPKRVATVAVQTIPIPATKAKFLPDVGTQTASNCSCIRTDYALQQRATLRQHTATVSQQTEPSMQTVGTNTPAVRPKLMQHQATETDSIEMRSFEQQTMDPPEKTYEQWIHEMSNTANGQLFLDRVEASLRKALYRQKNKMYKIHDIKLRHHRELLRMRYKRNFSESKVQNTNNETRQLMDQLGRHIAEFEARQQALMEKIQDAELAAQHAVQTVRPLLQVEGATAPQATLPESPPLQQQLALVERQPLESAQPLPSKLHHELKAEAAKLRQFTALLREHLPKISESAPRKTTGDSPRQIGDDPNMSQAVADAKARIQELEKESSCLEQNFMSYLERMRSEKEAECEATSRMRADCMQERKRLHDTVKNFTELQCQHDQRIANLNRIEMSFENELAQMTVLGSQEEDNAQALLSADAATKDKEAKVQLIFKNAIKEAKHKLFNSPQLATKKTDNDELLLDKYLLSDQLEFDIVSEQVAEWNSRDMCDQLRSYSSVGADELLLRFKAGERQHSLPTTTKLFAPSPGFMTESQVLTSTAIATTQITMSAHNEPLSQSPHMLKGLTKLTEISTTSSLFAENVNDIDTSDESNDENDDKSSRRANKNADMYEFDLYSSSSSTSLEETFDLAYRKHCSVIVGSEQVVANKDNAHGVLPSKSALTSKPPPLLTLPFMSTSVADVSSTIAVRGKLQRSIARMEVLFAPEESSESSILTRSMFASTAGDADAAELKNQKRS